MHILGNISKINQPNFHLRKLEKKRRIRVDINETENKSSVEKSQQNLNYWKTSIKISETLATLRKKRNHTNY